MTHDAMTLAVRSDLELGTLVQRLRRVLLSVDPELPLSHIATGTELISRSTQDRRFFAVLLGTFAAVGLTLAIVGIYGVTAFSVNRRRRELGLRMAVGARAGGVVGMVVGEAVRLAAIGGAVGLLASVALTRFVSSLLWEVRPGDPGVLTAAAFILILVAGLSALLPALRASRIDPVRALSGE
jgi:ABC-type antimicrobial peptide transport system permease subunit